MPHAAQPVSHDFLRQISGILAGIAAGMKKQVEESRSMLDKPPPKVHVPYGIRGEEKRETGEPDPENTR